MSAEVVQIATHRRPTVHGRGLSDHDCFTIAAALRHLPGHWLAERDEGADGAVIMALFADDSDSLPQYVVHRDAKGYGFRRGYQPAASVRRWPDVDAVLIAIRTDVSPS